MKPKLWAVGPTVFYKPRPRSLAFGAGEPGRCYDHESPVLHRVFVVEVGGIGEPNAGEFLVETPCGYRGWVQNLNRNPERRPACEACLNGERTRWVRAVFPPDAMASGTNDDTDEAPSTRP